MQLVYGFDQQVAAWVGQFMPTFGSGDGFGECTAIGIADNSALVAGAVFHNYRGHDIEISFAATNPRWATRGRVSAIMGYPFNQLGCARLTTVTGRKNKRARALDEKLGFKLEGVIRKGYDGQQDAMVYGMLKHECKWIRKHDG